MELRNHAEKLKTSHPERVTEAAKAKIKALQQAMDAVRDAEREGK